jgi:hypothetical protein
MDTQANLVWQSCAWNTRRGGSKCHGAPPPTTALSLISRVAVAVVLCGGISYDMTPFQFLIRGWYSP